MMDSIEQVNHDCPKPAELVYIQMPTESNIDETENLTPISIEEQSARTDDTISTKVECQINEVKPFSVGDFPVEQEVEENKSVE